VSHERAGRHNRIHNAAVDELGDDQTLFGHRHRSGQSHYDERVFVERHRFEHVGSLAKLPAGEGRLGHRAHQIVDRPHLGKIKRLQGDQPVFDGIVQLAVFSLAAVRLIRILRMMIAVFQRDLPSSCFF
jgi:hypothetical protein